MMSDKSKVIDYLPIRNDYQYGMMLAERGIGIEELSRDWPEVFESEPCMRGYREYWERQGYARPPGENTYVKPSGGDDDLPDFMK